MKFYCIADETRCADFAWPACPGPWPLPRRKPPPQSGRPSAQADCGILILTEKTADGIRPHVEQIRFERERPLIVEIPGPEGRARRTQKPAPARAGSRRHPPRTGERKLNGDTKSKFSGRFVRGNSRRGKTRERRSPPAREKRKRRRCWPTHRPKRKKSCVKGASRPKPKPRAGRN